MEVSIILPVYNSAKFLKQAIDSILVQSFQDFELIIINDGSFDDSELIIKSYNDTRIRYFYQSNSGVAATLNTGIGLARGEFIWRHDADDISLPSKLEEEIKFLRTHPHVALCACQVAFMTERGKIAWGFRQPGNDYFEEMPFKLVERSDFNPYSPITHGTVLIKTKIIKELGGYRPEFITGEDIDLWLRLIQKYEAVILNQCLSYHRLNKGSATQKHGWKNDFFKDLAFKYFDQRIKNGTDDLENGINVQVPEAYAAAQHIAAKGCRFRGDILLYSYLVHLNAKDWKEALSMIRVSISDGWRLSQTWKCVLLPLLGHRVVKSAVKVKSMFR